MAARPRTLPAAVAPVLVGTAAASASHALRPLILAAALASSILIQIGTNLANDYSDAVRGADSVDRLGPVRVTAAGMVTPRGVLIATWLAFAIAFAVGLYIAAVVGWEILAVGVVSIAAGVLYTGGPRPYGYEGLGELFVFLFFGLVAVNGSFYIQVEELAWLPFALSIPVGLLAAAILIVNNVRDIDSDRRAGKKTLAVRLGRDRARRLFTAVALGAYLLVPAGWLVPGGSPWVLLSWASLPLLQPLLRAVRTRADGPALNEALAASARLAAIFSALLSAGLLIA